MDFTRREKDIDEQLKQLWDVGFWKDYLPQKVQWSVLFHLLRKTRLTLDPRLLQESRFRRMTSRKDQRTAEARIFIQHTERLESRISLPDHSALPLDDPHRPLSQKEFFHVLLQLMDYRPGIDFFTQPDDPQTTGDPEGRLAEGTGEQAAQPAAGRMTQQGEDSAVQAEQLAPGQTAQTTGDLAAPAAQPSADQTAQAGEAPLELKDFLAALHIDWCPRWHGTALLSSFYSLLSVRGRQGKTLMDKAIEKDVFFHHNFHRKKPIPAFFAGRAMPVCRPDLFVTERVYVETDLDTDEDGIPDRIAVYIRRPGETERGMKVPVMFTANPYAAGWLEDLYKLHDVDGDLPVKPPRPQQPPKMEDRPLFPMSADPGPLHTTRPETLASDLPPPKKGSERIVSDRETSVKASADQRIPSAARISDPEVVETFEALAESMNRLQPWLLLRGVATVFSGGLGTRGSDGIRTCGSQEETLSTIAVIQWLTGDRRGYTSRRGGGEIMAWWCNGNVGMCGKSYLGTLAIAAASTGVPGLKCILAESAISDWYRYYRENGLPSAALDWQGDDADLLALSCMSRMLDPEDYETVRPVFEASLEKMRREQDRQSGDYNPFWHERNYLRNADRIKAAVCIVHGLNDWNVKPVQFGRYWRCLEKNRLKYGRQIKMILHQADHAYINTNVHLDYYELINQWISPLLWDLEKNSAVGQPDVLIQSNLDPAVWYGERHWPPWQIAPRVYCLGDGGQLAMDARSNFPALFMDDVSVSGFDRDPSHLPAWREAFLMPPAGARPDQLVYKTSPFARQTRLTGTIRLFLRLTIDRPAAILSAMAVDYGSACRLTEKTETVCPDGIPWGGGLYEDRTDYIREKSPSPCRIITRGHMNLQNREGICGAVQILPNHFYDYVLDLHPTDYTLDEGHRLGILIYGSDMELTPRPFVKTIYTLSPSESRVILRLSPATPL